MFKDEICYCTSISETLKDAEICFIFTEWDFIKEMDTNLFGELMKNPIIIDGRNCFDFDKIPKGVIYESIGRKTINN